MVQNYMQKNMMVFNIALISVFYWGFLFSVLQNLQ